MPDASLSFERFVVGGPNELAAAAARRAAETPGAIYNPLLICGGSGLGKTHLLHAIARYATALEPEIVVHLESADRIAQRLTEALSNGDLNAFVESFLEFDILLIDDIERLSGLEQVQVELGAVIHRMSVEGRQMVMASLAPPTELTRFQPGFIDVMTRGLVVDIGVPDAGMRRTLVTVFARDRKVVLPPNVAQALVDRDFPNVRSIRAAVTTILEAAAAGKREALPADLDLITADAEVTGERQGDEFEVFLDDVTRSLAAVVETTPWRQRVSEAILRWEAEGIRTTRLDDALLAQTAPDVDGLLGAFTRDATRLLEIRRELLGRGIKPTVADPVELAEAEAQLAAVRAERGEDTTRSDALPAADGDLWFLNPEKVILDWIDLNGRITLDVG